MPDGLSPATVRTKPQKDSLTAPKLHATREVLMKEIEMHYSEALDFTQPATRG